MPRPRPIPFRFALCFIPCSFFRFAGDSMRRRSERRISSISERILRSIMRSCIIIGSSSRSIIRRFSIATRSDIPRWYSIGSSCGMLMNGRPVRDRIVTPPGGIDPMRRSWKGFGSSTDEGMNTIGCRYIDSSRRPGYTRYASSISRRCRSLRIVPTPLSHVCRSA